MTLTVEQVFGPGVLTFGVGLSDFLVHDPGNGPVVYGSSGTGGGVMAFSVAPDGTLIETDADAHGAFLQPGISPTLALAKTASGDVLYGAGQDHGEAGQQVTGTGLGGDIAVTGLSERLTAPVAVEVGGVGYLFTAQAAGGIATLGVRTTGDLAPLHSLSDAPHLALAGLSAMTSLVAGGETYLIAASQAENAVSTLHVQPDGSLLPVDRVGAADGIGIASPSTVVAFTMEGNSFVAMGAAGTSTISVFAVADDGRLSLADHVTDSLATRFAGVTALDAIQIGNRTYLAAGGSDDGVTVFTIMPDGRLIALASQEDTLATTLQNVSALGLMAANGDLQILAAGTSEEGLTRLSLDLAGTGSVISGTGGNDVFGGTAQGDMLSGETGDDLLFGGGGADILVDGDGVDRMTGGPGADLFVLVADGVTDWITDFEIGIDRLDLSDWLLLYGVAQLSVTPTASGAVVTFGQERIEITTRTGTPLTAADLTDLDVVPLDRPPVFFADQTLAGSGGADTLAGGLGNDTLDGGAGEDDLSGGAGSDVLIGAAGFDLLYGGAGDDTLEGGPQADSLWGGAGADALIGGDGVDNLYGEAGDDTLRGDDGNDRLWGGAGNDTLFGGFQEDRLYGGDGDDTLLGDGGFDYLEGGDGDDLMRGGGQADNLFGGLGHDALFGDGGFDRLFGGVGQDTLDGGDDDDALFGEQGDDWLLGGAGDDRLNGGPGSDTVEGGAGNDALRGGSDFDTLIGGAGDDTLTGDFNADTFVFADGFGTDRITDFEATNDFERIDLAGVASVSDWATLQTYMTQNGADVWIDTAPGDRLVLESVALADLDAVDFLF